MGISALDCCPTIRRMCDPIGYIVKKKIMTYDILADDFVLVRGISGVFARDRQLDAAKMKEGVRECYRHLISFSTT